jgi:hypothetical protein
MKWWGEFFVGVLIVTAFALVLALIVYALNN